MSTPPQQPLIEQLLGANWRTTVSGLFTTLSAIILILVALPPETWQSPKVWIPVVIGAIAKTIKDVQTKDAKVGGTGTPDDPHRVDDGGESPRTIPVSVIASLLLPAFLFTSCAQLKSTAGKLPTFAIAALPVADAVLIKAGEHYGIPASDSKAAILAFNDLWGAYAQVQAGQPAQDGASTPETAAAIATTLPANSPPATQAALLQMAASLIKNLPSLPASGKAIVPPQAHRARPHFRNALPTLYSANDQPVAPVVILRER